MAGPDFSDKTKLILAFRAAMICSRPVCRTITVGPSESDPTLRERIGEAAHIHGARPGPRGARYDGSMTDAQRSHPSNGIWLCASCHSLVDANQGIDYPVAELRRWKADHEALIGSLVRTHESPVPMLMRTASEGRIAQDAVDVCENAAALYDIMAREDKRHVLKSIKKLRAEFMSLNRQVVHNRELKRILKQMAAVCKGYMNHTSVLPDSWEARLEMVRQEMGLYLKELSRLYRCQIPTVLQAIVP